MVAECIRGRSYTGITHPQSACTLRSLCPIGGKAGPPPVAFLETKSKVSQRVGFPKLAPEVDLTDERSWFWRYGAEFDAIFTPLWQLLVNEDMLSEASRSGLHDYLGFTGRILLSTVMPDELIDKLDREQYFRLIKDLRPDATMVPDNYTYVDMPLYQSWSQTIRLVTLANDFLDLDIPVIGLVKGAIAQQYVWALRKQVEMGYVSFALPSRELFKQGLLGGAMMSARYVFERSRPDAELLFYGLAYPVRRVKASYSNLSWFIEANRAHIFGNGRLHDIADPEISSEKCDCEACRGRTPTELVDLQSNHDEYVRTLAHHNLLDLKKVLSGEKHG